MRIVAKKVKGVSGLTRFLIENYKWWMDMEFPDLKGNDHWTFGIEFKTKDGKWNGNTANPVKLKGADKVITLYWDEIEELAGALKALDKELPKEFRDSPGYSGPSTFIDEAKKWIGTPNEKTYKPNKQEDGKNWDSKENRRDKPVLSKKDSQNTNDTVIVINQWERRPYVTTNHSKDTTVKKSDVDKIKKDREWKRGV